MEESATTQRYVVSFLDILGYSNIVSKQDPEKTEKLFKAVQEAVYSANETSRSFAQKALDKYGYEASIIARTLGFRVYSDNITVYCGLHPDSDEKFKNAENAVAIGTVLMIQAKIQTMLLCKHHLLSNGGTAIGSFSVKENFLFGKALVDAYELGNIADGPRMLVTRDVKNTLQKSAQKAGYKYKEKDYEGLFVWDFDGDIFVRYLTANAQIEQLLSGKNIRPASEQILKEHRDSILAAIEENEKDIRKYRRIRHKYVWAASYHNAEVGNTESDLAIDMQMLYDMELPAPGEHGFSR